MDKITPEEIAAKVCNGRMNVANLAHLAEYQGQRLNGTQLCLTVEAMKQYAAQEVAEKDALLKEAIELLSYAGKLLQLADCHMTVNRFTDNYNEALKAQDEIFQFCNNQGIQSLINKITGTKAGNDGHK